MKQQIARDEEQERRRDHHVEGRPGPCPGRNGGYFVVVCAGLLLPGSTLAPQEQTMLRVAHWMLRSLPQLPQHRYVPGRRAGDVTRFGMRAFIRSSSLGTWGQRLP